LSSRNPLSKEAIAGEERRKVLGFRANYFPMHSTALLTDNACKIVESSTFIIIT